LKVAPASPVKENETSARVVPDAPEVMVGASGAALSMEKYMVLRFVLPKVSVARTVSVY
jgi:hypothetical protein